MTTHAVIGTDVLSPDGVNPACTQVVMQFDILVVIRVVGKIHPGIPVAFYAPAHGQIGMLTHDVHLFHRTVALCAIQLSRTHMNGMAEKNMLRQVVDPDPLQVLPHFSGINHFGDFETAAVGAFTDQYMTVQTEVGSRNACRFTVIRRGMTVHAINALLAGMHLVGEFYRLVRSISLLPAETAGRVDLCLYPLTCAVTLKGFLR